MATDIKAVSKIVELVGKLSRRAQQWLTWRIVAEAELYGLSLRPPTGGQPE